MIRINGKKYNAETVPGFDSYQGHEAKIVSGVNTQSGKAVAIAEAESIRIKGLAEAESITAKAKALGNNPLIVKLTEAQNWDGKLPATMLGGQNMPILDLRAK